MQAQCVKIPLIAGKTQRFLQWVKGAKSRRAEMLASMSHEGVTAEAMFLERDPIGDTLLFYMQGEDLARSQAIFASSNLAVDREARAIIEECWDLSRAHSLEVLLDFVGRAS
jgi:DNA-binding transcriptional regulator PaaX